jgi:hypothetical protein
MYVRCKPCSYLALTLKLSPNRQKRGSTWPISLTSFIGCIQNYLWAYGTFSETMHLSCVKISTISKWPNRAPLDPHHIGVPSGSSKTIYEPMVRLMQTEHLSCTDANTISKQIETKFHMTHVTYEFHRVPPILFLSLRYVPHKPSTNLASRVALSSNGPNWASSWASSPRSPIECIQNDVYAYGMFSTNHAPILHWH